MSEKSETLYICDHAEECAYRRDHDPCPHSAPHDPLYHCKKEPCCYPKRGDGTAVDAHVQCVLVVSKEDLCA